MNRTIEINKNYKQTVQLNDRLVAETNDFINLSIQVLAVPTFQVKLTAQNIVDILMEKEDDPILTDNIVCSAFPFESSIAELVKTFFAHLAITEGVVKWLSPVKIVEVAEKIF